MGRRCQVSACLVRIWRAAELCFAGRTCIIVSHRHDVAARADRVVFMEDGRVVDCGTHEELLARAPRYRQLCALSSAAAETR
jgi:ABC-type multidrug transport system fused ATPase/permease subunit